MKEMNMKNEYQLVLCTCPDLSVAQTLATALVSQKLAACVNILPNVTSVYLWQGKVECDTEVQLLIKTITASFTQLNSEINKLHPYDIPEVIALNIQQGDQHYLNWISESLK